MKNLKNFLIIFITNVITFLKPSDESFFNLLEGQTTGKILHFYYKYVLC